MVSKLKELSEDDLEDISNFLSETIEKKIQASVKSQKEILDMDVSIEISYPDENGELDVDASIEIDTDELSDLSNERIDEVIDELKLVVVPRVFDGEYFLEHLVESFILPVLRSSLQLEEILEGLQLHLKQIGISQNLRCGEIDSLCIGLF